MTVGMNREMQISQTASLNHEVFFPDHHSTLRISDPELIEIFDNFAFDEVLKETKLEIGTRTLLILASMIGSQAVSEFKVMAVGALNVGVEPAAIREVLYQAVPYVGMSKAFDFIHAINEVFNQRGIDLPLKGQSTTAPNDRLEKGLNVQKQIFGGMIDDMYANSPEDQLHIQNLLSANCFGDYYTRGVLDIKTRELVTLSILVALGGVDAQVKGHVQGNINVGNGRKLLVDLATQLLPWVGYPRTLNFLKAINNVTGEQNS